MSIYVIGDLHLSFANPKPMDIFGENWKNHEEKIKNDWKDKVKENDTVIILGDFSWAMELENMYEDFKYLSSLPGRKILLKGNHDYWWTSLKKLNEYLKENNFKNIEFMQNNSFEIEGKIIAGTRGWNFEDTEEDKKILDRELLRLELSIQDGIKKFGTDKEIIVCMHYPPVTKQILKNSKFIEVMKKYNVKKCFYGHLHGEALKEAVNGEIDGIKLTLASSDGLDFKLIKIGGD